METENLSRRKMLRGVLALGCGASLPLVLFGCDSRKKPEPLAASPAAPAGPPAGSAEKAKPVAPPKLAQTNVQFQPLPRGEQKCGTCNNFIAESNTCMLVEGTVTPEGWCSLWTKKT